MKKNITNLHLTLLAFISLVASCMLSHYITYETIATLPQNVAIQEAQAFADAHINDTWEYIQTTTGIRVNDCDAYLLEYGQIIRDQIKARNESINLAPLTETTQAMVKLILEDCHMDANTINIAPITRLDTPAKAGINAIYIDEAKLQALSLEAQQFIIAHEISHIKFKDSLYATALLNVLKAHKITDYHQALNAFLNAIEVRADIYALITDEQYSLGGINTFQEYMANYGDHEDPTHPLPSKRLEMAQNIHAIHKNQVKSFQEVAY